MTIIIIKFYLIFILLFNGYIKKDKDHNSVKTDTYGFNRDDVKVNNIISGVRHYEYIKSDYPWVINVLEIDLTQKNIIFESVKSNDKLFGGREKISAMVERKIKINNNVIGAINADFFDLDNGNINNIQISNGEFIRGINTRKSIVVFNYENKPYIDKFKIACKIQKGINRFLKIDAINLRRGKDSVVMYNKYWGSRTQTKGQGKEITIHPVGEWKINEPMKVVAISVDDSNSTISADDAVLSGQGKYGDSLYASISIGDTINLFLELNPKNDRIKEALGGLPQIVKEGKDISETQTIKEGGSEKFLTTRHPRSAIGYNKEKTKLYLLVVDGRQSKSVGMQLAELAQFMISIGCYDVLNFDGGGSTTMMIRDKIVNSPSDLIGERAVGNALLLFTK
jgi:exopolysaccharide biosynthesis protein